MIPLSSSASYSKKRISTQFVNCDNYISVDNILQNKAGISRATNFSLNYGDIPKYEDNHILVGNIRPYLKKIWFANKTGGCSPDVLNFEINDGFDSKFVYYCLLADTFFIHMMKGAKGSKMPRGDKNQIMSFLIPQLGLPEQIKISSILSKIDEKIQLNNKISTKLEIMAKLIYDYWFVQFDFPNKNGKPYKTSGGKMEWNQELKRKIPEGWKKTKLSQVANIIMGQSPPGDSYNQDDNGPIFYQGSTDFGNRYPTIRKYTTTPLRFAKKGDILLSVRAPVGDMNIANHDCCIGRGLAALNSKIGAQGYLYEVMKYFKQVFDIKNGNGTTFGSITKDDLFNLPLVCPPNQLIMQFEAVISPMYARQNLIEIENQKLIRLRDWLLPMLMSGQIKVRQN